MRRTLYRRFADALPSATVGVCETAERGNGAAGKPETGADAVTIA